MTRTSGTRLLVVDDDATHRGMLQTLLADWGYRTECAGDGETAVTLCREAPFDLILMDLRMGVLSGIGALREIRAYNPAIPILIMTAYSNVESAVDAIRSGAYDYLTKPLDFEELRLTLERALDHAALRDENAALKTTLAASFDPAGIIGQSQSMHRLMDMMASIAPSEATVLVTGESGTGKELIARAIHANSQRRHGPYVTVNCAALTETLLESELFGHEKGAFTGAEKRREGRFQSADKGTIFLDEIGETSLPMQAKLLRAIQEREIQRVGSDQTLRVDVRIIAATNRDLRAEVEAGRFRQDLYYRLNVVTLHVPPLRERVEDIPLLAGHFLRRFTEKNGKRVKGFTPQAMDRLLKHDWPGNVRELENAAERAVVLLVGEYISERELPHAIAGEDGDATCAVPRFNGMTLEEIERAAILDAMDVSEGNKSEAARRLGITRKTLHAKLNRYADDEQ
ncbi:sigma 54-interacting transcriptional regulator [Nitratidesulfovibrio sp. SRB-5]|uniref:sigma 54-interacting transcriptional regulator n=1 Tax=Nitratidesulfovibrio sp. SRB-5 TaxID=2872636 RepID=UPI00102511B2|nr:sigma 54-interacting transcriptional regulator [Nitratidesulfovibrio sp. SRB-5]MBZ2172861.1 sigma 54-interacting transcriptional regulator [Nitratidesulfovibrio sp. SRB-5]RXF76768.1 response regulator [Desulfovibrio sp. DS-1]